MIPFNGLSINTKSSSQAITPIPSLSGTFAARTCLPCNPMAAKEPSPHPSQLHRERKVRASVENYIYICLRKSRPGGNKRYSKCGYACSLKHLKSLPTFVLADS